MPEAPMLDDESTPSASRSCAWPGRAAPRAVEVVAAAALALLVCGPASARQPEYELDPGGRWLETPSAEAQPEGEDAALIDEARRLIALEDGRGARRLLHPWLEANKRTDNPYLPEAYLLRGDAWVLIGDEYKALFDYEVIIRDFTASPEFPVAVERELEIATRYANGLKRRFFGLRIERAEGLGEELLIRVQERMPGSELAERAALVLADYYDRERQTKMAAEMYDIFVQNHPQSEHVREAKLGQVYATAAGFKGPQYNGAGLTEASILLDEYARRYPADAARTGVVEGLASRIDESAAGQMLSTAEWYMDRGDEPAAEFTLRRLLRRHPTTTAAQEALALMTERGWLAAEPEPEPQPAEPDAAEPEAPSPDPAASEGAAP